MSATNMDEEEHLEALEGFKVKAEIFDAETQISNIQTLPTIAKEIGESTTRSHLIPYLKDYLNKIYCLNEVHPHFAAILSELHPLLGGSEHVELLFDLYESLSVTEELSTRGATISSLKSVAEGLDVDTLKGPFVEFLARLLEKESFVPKTVALGVFPLVYTRVPENVKSTLRELYMGVYQDESPSMRRSHVASLKDFVQILEPEYVDTIGLGLLLSFSTDSQEIVRGNCVEIITVLSKLLDEQQVEDHVVKILQNLMDDISPLVKLQLARNLLELQSSFGPNLSRKHLIGILESLSESPEVEIRATIARSLVEFCAILQGSYAEPRLDPLISVELLNVVKKLSEDSSEEVQLNMSKEVMKLALLMDKEQIKVHLLPLVQGSFEMDSWKLGEVFVDNLNDLLLLIGYEDMEEFLHKTMFKLLSVPTPNWRARRQLILTVNIMSSLSSQDHFTKSMLPFLQKLLRDEAFAVRKSTPLLLPGLIAKFGMSWAKRYLLNWIFCLADHPSYLQRYIVLYCLDEIIEPTLQVQVDTYLEHIRTSPDKLYRVQYLNEFLDVVLYENWVESVCSNYNCSFPPDQSFYSEDLLHLLKPINVFQPPPAEVYLEELLIVLIKYVLSIVKKLSEDSVDNVKYRTANTITKIVNLKKRLNHELELVWVQEGLDQITADEKEQLRKDVHEILSEEEPWMKMEANHEDSAVGFIKRVFNYERIRAQEDRKKYSADQMEAKIIEDEAERGNGDISLSESLEFVALVDNCESIEV